MNAVEMKGLVKKYEGFTLGPLNLTLPGGYIMGLIGENGAGKTTAIKLLLDIVQKDDGKIVLLGKENGQKDYLLKEEIGVVLDEIGFPEVITAHQVGKIMQHTYTNWDESLYKQLLDKLDVPIEKEFKDLSKGNKMKLGIICALSHHPKLLILDEPTSGLDPVMREEVVEIFYEFTREENHSILISSHIVSDLEKLCDYIAFLKKGQLMLCEEKDRLLEEYGMVFCTREQMEELSSEAVIGKRVSPYGMEIIVKRDKVPAALEIRPVTIEDLFVFMAKEDK